MKTSGIFTLEELEKLSEAYLECRLSKIQEKELELVLNSMSLSSPVLEEARLSMGIETVLSQTSVRCGAVRRRKPSRLRIAACIAILAVSVALIAVNMHSSSGDTLSVYVDGKSLSGEIAKARAMEIEKSSMEMLKDAMLAAERERNRAIGSMNEIIDKQ